jgi:DNA repair ATPase RecN
MLRELRIKNFAVIDEVALELGPGLNIITGETGAGKSIILNALGLVSGERAARISFAIRKTRLRWRLCSTACPSSSRRSSPMPASSSMASW